MSRCTLAPHAFGRTDDGDIFGLGRNSEGQLGTGELLYAMNLVAAGGSRKFSHVATKMYHSLGIAEDGTLWTWGSNAYGELGRTSTETCSDDTACATEPGQVQMQRQASN